MIVWCGGWRRGRIHNPSPAPKKRIRVAVKIASKANSLLLVDMKPPKPELSPWR